jgi:hypothetical protein
MKDVNLGKEYKYVVVKSSINNFSLFLSHNGISEQKVCLKCCEIKKRIIGRERRRKIKIFSMKGYIAVIPKALKCIIKISG